MIELWRRMRPHPRRFWGFDSFTGLPPPATADEAAAERRVWSAGEYAADPRAAISRAIGPRAGWVGGPYNTTLRDASVVGRRGLRHARYVDIDVDRYSSASEVRRLSHGSSMTVYAREHGGERRQCRLQSHFVCAPSSLHHRPSHARRRPALCSELVLPPSAEIASQVHTLFCHGAITTRRRRVTHVGHYPHPTRSAYTLQQQHCSAPVSRDRISGPPIPRGESTSRARDPRRIR